MKMNKDIKDIIKTTIIIIIAGFVIYLILASLPIWNCAPEQIGHYCRIKPFL